MSVTKLNLPAIEHSYSNLQNINPVLTTVNSYEKHPDIQFEVQF